MDKGKQLTEEGFQCKRKWAMSIDSDEFVPEEGLMADARHIDREEEFLIINPGTDPTGRLANIVDHCRQLPLLLRVRLPV